MDGKLRVSSDGKGVEIVTESVRRIERGDFVMRINTNESQIASLQAENEILNAKLAEFDATLKEAQGEK